MGSFSPPLERVSISVHNRQGVVLSTLRHEREAESSLILSRGLLVLLFVDLELEKESGKKWTGEEAEETAAEAAADAAEAGGGEAAAGARTEPESSRCS